MFYLFLENTYLDIKVSSPAGETHVDTLFDFSTKVTLFFACLRNVLIVQLLGDDHPEAWGEHGQGLGCSV